MGKIGWTWNPDESQGRAHSSSTKFQIEDLDRHGVAFHTYFSLKQLHMIMFLMIDVTDLGCHISSWFGNLVDVL
jgi:hypothetical protein